MLTPKETTKLIEQCSRSFRFELADKGGQGFRWRGVDQEMDVVAFAVGLYDFAVDFARKLSQVVVKKILLLRS